MSSESSRFQHLLQPIRDLSKNWNIDLAQELEEYLDELENLTIAFDQDGVQVPRTVPTGTANGVQLMNFAEAALLIQGTSMIYSRKVEYLYALVFQTLAHLSKQQDNHHGGLSAANGDDQGDDNDPNDDGVDADGTARRKRQALDVFANPLPIYDELEEARNITLRRPNDPLTPGRRTTPGRNATPGRTPGRRGRSTVMRSQNNIQASIALMGSLVPDERDHGETFKLLSCHLHPSGVLLMDEASKKYLRDEQALYENGFAQTPAHQHLQHTPMAKLNFDAHNTSIVSDGHHEPDLNGDHHGPDDDVDDEHNEPMDDAGYDFGGGYDPVDDDQDGNVEPQADGMADIFSAPIKPEPMNDNVSKATTPKTTRSVRMVTIADAKDPWEPLDAYDASKSTVRPFRKGRSYPARTAKKMLANKKKKSNGMEDDEIDGVDDPAFKERFLLSANRPQWSTWVWNDLDDRALETKFKKKYCKGSCLMTSCESVWRLETKWKSLMRKCVASEEQSAQAILLQEQAEEEEELQIHAMTLNNGAALGMNDPFVSDVQAQEVEGGDDDDDDDGGVDSGVEYDGGDVDDWGQNTSFTLFDNTAVLKNGGLGQIATEQDGERAQTYEEICRQHLEEFMKGTEKYIRETDLTRQVNDWQEKLNPILREQDAHPPFDIHKYGRNILEHLETSTGANKRGNKRRKRKQEEADEPEDDDEDATAVPFGDVVGGLNQFEVCRMFLASLQLANNGNVQLHHGKTAAEQARVPFEMQLLSTSNVYESLQHETTVA